MKMMSKCLRLVLWLYKCFVFYKSDSAQTILLLFIEKFRHFQPSTILLHSLKIPPSQQTHLEILNDHRIRNLTSPN